MKIIKCSPGDLDEYKTGNFSHFTVRKGKAKYHLLSLARQSCGIYYAWRVGPEGLEGRRALEPTDEIRVHLTPAQPDKT